MKQWSLLAGATLVSWEEEEETGKVCSDISEHMIYAATPRLVDVTRDVYGQKATRSRVTLTRRGVAAYIIVFGHSRTLFPVFHLLPLPSIECIVL